MNVFNIRATKIPAVLEALKEFGVSRWDIRNNMDFVRGGGGATYYAKNYMETAALLSVANKV